jgi:hypothetical protein
MSSRNLDQQITDQFLSDLDDKSNPLKSKGVGELGMCGSGASVANAIYDACGVRVRGYTIMLDMLILDPAFPEPDLQSPRAQPRSRGCTLPGGATLQSMPRCNSESSHPAP